MVSILIEKNRVNGEISRLETSLEESVNEVNADIEEINNEIEENKQKLSIKIIKFLNF